jgi:hypothetical protein
MENIFRQLMTRPRVSMTDRHFGHAPEFQPDREVGVLRERLDYYVKVHNIDLSNQEDTNRHQ